MNEPWGTLQNFDEIEKQFIFKWVVTESVNEKINEHKTIHLKNKNK